MDSTGKDGAIRHVMLGVNPQGCQVFSFKHPTANELEHDLLWRTTLDLLERGRIGIFNRSYYEEVLIARVHPEILGHEALPDALLLDPAVRQGRYQSIRDLEAHLHRNGTRVVKFSLLLSQKEQRKRFLARTDEPEKNQKFSVADIQDRKFWKQYMTVYEKCVPATSRANNSRYVVPADDKYNARLIVPQILLDILKGLDMHYPKMSPERLKELHSIREQLAKGNVQFHRVRPGKHFMDDQSGDKLHPIESKYVACAALVGFLLTLLLTDGSLVAAFGALGLVAGIGWATHRLLHSGSG